MYSPDMSPCEMAVGRSTRGLPTGLDGMEGCGIYRTVMSLAEVPIHF